MPVLRRKNLSYDSTGCLEIKGSTYQQCWIVCVDCGAEGPAVEVVDDINAGSVPAEWNTRSAAIPTELKTKVLELCDSLWAYQSYLPQKLLNLIETVQSQLEVTNAAPKP